MNFNWDRFPLVTLVGTFFVQKIDKYRQFQKKIKNNFTDYQRVIKKI